MVYEQFALIPLRLVLGAIFIIHGYAKLKDLKGTGEFLAGLGWKPGNFWAPVLAAVEFLGGLAILFGFLSRIGIIFLLISMLVAVYTVKFKFKKSFVAGYEFDLLIIAGLVTMLLLSPGQYSVYQLVQQYVPVQLAMYLI